VRGVTVGHISKVRGADVRTGVTLIDPGVPDLFRKKIPAAVAVGNGAGKVAGFTQVEEFGTLETPIAFTNTLAVGPVMRGITELVLESNKKLPPYTTVNAVVGEVNDWRLNDIRRDSIAKEDVLRAYRARRADFAVGAVGGGTGSRAFSWKGGIGSASRAVPVGKKKWMLGALVQTNFGGALTILGVPVGKLLGARWSAVPGMLNADRGSCMAVLATDAPLTARQLTRIASRSFLALGKVGAVMAHASGDYAIACTTSREGLEGSGRVGRCISDGDLNLFFEAAIETVEESVYDALFSAVTVQGRNGNVLEALPVKKVLPLLRERLGVYARNEAIG
jgi:D-aminopeptidase